MYIEEIEIVHSFHSNTTKYVNNLEEITSKKLYTVFVAFLNTFESIPSEET